MQKALIIILAATSLALGVLCARQYKQLNAEVQQVQAAQEKLRVETDSRQAAAARVEELKRNEARLEKQVQDFTKMTATLRASEAAQASNVTLMTKRFAAATMGQGGAADGDPGSESNGAGLAKGMGDMLGKMMKDPAMREMVRDQQKAAIKMMYSGLIKDLKLTPDEKDKFTELMTDGQMKAVEAAKDLMGGKKDVAEQKDAQKLVEQAKQQSDAEIKALLGEERFAQFTDYQKNIQERMQVDQLGKRLDAANLPLQSQQTADLLQIMKEEKAAVPPVIPSDATQAGKNMEALMNPENVDRQLKWMDDYNARVLARAAQVLTPEQLKEYRDYQEQQASMQKVGLQMARQMFGNGKAAPPAPAPAAK